MRYCEAAGIDRSWSIHAIPAQCHALNDTMDIDEQQQTEPSLRPWLTIPRHHHPMLHNIPFRLGNPPLALNTAPILSTSSDAPNNSISPSLALAQKLHVATKDQTILVSGLPGHQICRHPAELPVFDDHDGPHLIASWSGRCRTWTDHHHHCGSLTSILGRKDGQIRLCDVNFPLYHSARLCRESMRGLTFNQSNRSLCHVRCIVQRSSCRVVRMLHVIGEDTTICRCTKWK